MEIWLISFCFCSLIRTRLKLPALETRETPMAPWVFYSNSVGEGRENGGLCAHDEMAMKSKNQFGDHQSLLCTHYGLSEVKFVQTSNHLRWTEVQHVQHVDGRIMSRDKQAGLCSQKITIQSACSGICIARSWRRRTDFFDCWPPCSSRNLNILKHLIGPWAVRAWHTLTSLNQYMRTHNRYTSYFINSWFIRT